MAGNVQNDATGHYETCTAANVTIHASVLCSGASNRQHTVQGCMRHHQTTFVMVLMLASGWDWLLKKVSWSSAARCWETPL